MNLRIAIIGAGFTGLATAWHLLQKGAQEVVVFDAVGIGGGASGIATGLMHPFAGAHAKLNWQGKEGFDATLKLLHAAEIALGEPVADRTGLLRLAITQEQVEDYSFCAQKHDDIKWLTQEQVHAAWPMITPYPGIWIENAITVHSRKYLEGLWLACKAKGAIEVQKKIASIDELDDFHVVVIAAGYHSHLLADFTLPLTPVKGQVLTLRWPEEIPQLSIPINSYAYLVRQSPQHDWIAGATYEREFTSSMPDIKIATKEILPKIQAFCPFLTEKHVIDCHAAIRASTPDHKPIIKRMNAKCWVITGFGSKGLLYHALFADRLSNDLLQHHMGFSGKIEEEDDCRG